MTSSRSITRTSIADFKTYCIATDSVCRCPCDVYVSERMIRAAYTYWQLPDWKSFSAKTFRSLSVAVRRLSVAVSQIYFCKSPKQTYALVQLKIHLGISTAANSLHEVINTGLKNLWTSLTRLILLWDNNLKLCLSEDEVWLLCFLSLTGLRILEDVEYQSIFHWSEKPLKTFSAKTPKLIRNLNKFFFMNLSL